MVAYRAWAYGICLMTWQPLQLTWFHRILSEVSHVIMDEIHERNVNSDFLTIIMRDLLPRR